MNVNEQLPYGLCLKSSNGGVNYALLNLCLSHSVIIIIIKHMPEIGAKKKVQLHV